LCSAQKKRKPKCVCSWHTSLWNQPAGCRVPGEHLSVEELQTSCCTRAYTALSITGIASSFCGSSTFSSYQSCHDQWLHDHGSSIRLVTTRASCCGCFGLQYLLPGPFPPPGFSVVALGSPLALRMRPGAANLRSRLIWPPRSPCVMCLLPGAALTFDGFFVHQVPLPHSQLPHSDSSSMLSCAPINLPVTCG
jgi:hypothetical protein